MKIDRIILFFILIILLVTCPAPQGPPEKPGEPGIIEGDGEVFVYWSPVSRADAYDVWYGTDNNSGNAQQYGDDVVVPNTRITGLVNGTPYYIWIRAKNNAGESGFSPPGSGTPAAGASTNRIYVNGTEFRMNGLPIWMNGCNTPWDNWNDFGGNYDSSFWADHYALLPTGMTWMIFSPSPRIMGYISWQPLSLLIILRIPIQHISDGGTG